MSNVRRHFKRKGVMEPMILNDQLSGGATEAFIALRRSHSGEMRISSLESKTSMDLAFAMIMPQQMTRHAAIRSRACRDLGLIFSAPAIAC
ncbi:hypothetical protein [Rhizobium azibense]|uniref:hypothetical protein n=1 Tax=Rhizobium azibense TaxID=1136135 RepID=UPI0010507E3F|nr:hypothetical protein [Rhizobium azibense]